MSDPENAIAFHCPTCEAQYKVVRVKAPPRNDRELLCQKCGGPLRNRANSRLNTSPLMGRGDV